MFSSTFLEKTRPAMKNISTRDYSSYMSNYYSIIYF